MCDKKSIKISFGSLENSIFLYDFPIHVGFWINRLGIVFRNICFYFRRTRYRFQ